MDEVEDNQDQSRQNEKMLFIQNLLWAAFCLIVHSNELKMINGKLHDKQQTQ